MKSVLIHMFKTPGGYYLYDANKNAVVRLPKNVFDTLNNSEIINENYLEDKKLSTEENNVIKRLIESGFLSNHTIREIVHPEDDVIEFNLSRKLWMITLQVTQQCNLRCEYCVYSGGYENRLHSNKRMDFDMAKKCIDFIIARSIDSGKIVVGFYGGEPLIEIELIKKCIEYTETKVEGKDCFFTLTTNATLLNKEIVEYFIQHNVQLTISLDGPANIHDKNRKFIHGGQGSFNKVMDNIEEIRNNFPDYYKKISISTVLDPRSDFSCTNSFFTNFDTIKEAMTSVSFINEGYSKNKVGISEDFYTKLNYEYFKIFLSKLGKLDEKYTSRLVREHYYETRKAYEKLKPSDGLKDKMHPSGPCIPGITRLFVNADGYIYPCERVSESSVVMRIGHIDYGFDINRVKQLLNIGKITENQCKSCWAYRFCTLCAQSADNMTELSAEKRCSNCISVKKEAEGKLMDVCMLKECGLDFGSEDFYFSV